MLDIAGTAFGAACRSAGGLIERRLQLAGFSIALRFAGPGLVPLLARAFSHLPPADAGTPPDLSIALWDGASTGHALPPIPGMAQAGTGKLVQGGSVHRALTMSAKADSGVVSLLDAGHGRGYCYVPDAARLPASETAAPLLAILHGWLSGRDALIVHAAAVGGAQAGVLLVGRGGSGKSTTALACALAGLGYTADDYCLVRLAPEVTVHCLYASAKLHPASLQRVGMTPPTQGERIHDKHLLFLAEQDRIRLQPSFPLQAVVVPCIRGGPTSALEPVSPAVALRALAPSTLLQLPGAAATLLRAMATMLHERPCYALQLGSDPASATTLIRDLIGE